MLDTMIETFRDLVWLLRTASASFLFGRVPSSVALSVVPPEVDGGDAAADFPLNRAREAKAIFGWCNAH